MKPPRAPDLQEHRGGLCPRGDLNRSWEEQAAASSEVRTQGKVRMLPLVAVRPIPELHHFSLADARHHVGDGQRPIQRESHHRR